MESDHSLVFRGAQNPSVSADGRYIVFSTAQQLVPQDDNENVDVYVRDMDVPLTTDRKDSGAYALVSAKNGGEEPATYAPRSPPLPGANPGADVWPNTSISANGRYVAFRTPETESDLPDHLAVNTPKENLFVRDLSAKTTTLISSQKKGEPEAGEPAGGAIGPTTHQRRRLDHRVGGDQRAGADALPLRRVAGCRTALLPLAAVAGSRLGHSPCHGARRSRRPSLSAR